MPVADNALRLLAEERNAHKSINWALKFIERGFEPDSKLMLLLDHWLKNPPSAVKEPVTVTAAQQAPAVKSVADPKPKRQLDYTALTALWVSIRNRCGGHLADIIGDLAKADKSSAVLLHHGPEAWATMAVEKVGQPEQEVYDQLQEMLDELEGNLASYIERQEERIRTQLQKLEQKRLKFLAEAGFTQRRDVPVAHRPVLCTKIEQQYEDALADSPRETVASLSEGLDIAIGFVSSKSTTEFPASKRAAARHAALIARTTGNGDSDTTEPAKKTVSLGPVPKVGAPNAQAMASGRGTVAGIGGGGNTRTVNKGQKAKKQSK
jgi:hypothetical protein